ncbi:hypothetical protein APHAL10511_001673 [Amanita phalloides]|nr:hypothetical protein APHAL10511_001673 [Amanita phalloides]
MDADETFVLLLLADSALPTGAFVASSGLESYCAHGFPALFSSPQHALLHFVRQSLATYAHSTLPYVADAHCVVSAAKARPDGDITLSTLLGLDQLFHASTLNQVTRRASTSQGVALLTLLSKGLSAPHIDAHLSSSSSIPAHLSSLVDEFKSLVRRQSTPGHLPVCWGIITAALGLSLGSHPVLCPPSE